MIRQPSYDLQFQGMTMGGGHHHHPNNHHRLVMTAPRPRLHRLLNEEGSFDDSDSDPEEVIRKNLFAPPVVVQNEIFRTESTADNDPQKQMIHRQPVHRSSVSNGINRPARYPQTQTLLRTPPKNMRKHMGGMGGRGNTCSKVTRTGSDQFCGLSAEITREISYRTPAKTPGKAPGSVMNTPVSKDLFRAKASAPMTDSKLMTIQLAKTASMSSSDGGSPRGFPYGVGERKRVAMKKEGPKTMNKSMAVDIGTAAPRRSVTTATTTPKTKPKRQKIRKTPFPGVLSGRKKIKKCLTPPRNAFGSHMKASRTHSSAANSELSGAFDTAYDGVNDYRLTSTEHDPAPFQVELPSKKEMMVHSKICALMDGYTAVHRDFNFAMLSGISHSTLKNEVERSTDEKPMIAGSCHRDVVKTLLECADDIVVEGFFREYTEGETDEESERMEAVILSSESLRQIIVCFRGSTANQAKPLRNSLFGKQGSSMLHEEHKVPVIDAFRSIYFGTPLEKTVFALLANLASRKPFFDIVTTGHSFGAAMATIAAFRYASANSQMRVSCHVFGSPRVGGEEWRRVVHSVPNLRVYRAENGSDPYVLLPNGNEWSHCGHAIQITDMASASGKDGVEFKARRFDNDHPASYSGNNLLAKMMPKNLGVTQSTHQGKVDHEIQSYVEKLTSSGDHWFADFCELKGKGVSGANNEIRTLA